MRLEIFGGVWVLSPHPLSYLNDILRAKNGLYLGHIRIYQTQRRQYVKWIKYKHTLKVY